jgi:hypothetical protein
MPASTRRWRACRASDIHPLQPVSTVPGALDLLELARYLMTLTGMPAVALSPKAGAHGEACGMMAIKAAIAAKGARPAMSCSCPNRPTAPTGDGRADRLHRPLFRRGRTARSRSRTSRRCSGRTSPRSC